MPISGPASYVQTTEQFLSHWELANSVSPPGVPLLVPSLAQPPGPAIAIATLETLYQELLDKRAELQSKLNSQEMARGAINQLKALLLARANLFNEAVRGQLPGSVYEEALPNVPGILMSQAPFTEPLDDAVDVWQRINDDAGIGADIVLSDGTTQAPFAADVETLKTLYRNFNKAEVHTGFTRSQRNRIQDKIYPILKQYRAVLPTKFPKDHELIPSMPKLSPEPGSTPDAVSMTAVFNSATNQVEISHTKSDAADFAEYEYQMVPGPVWSEEDATVIGNVTNINSLTFTTTQGVQSPGVTATYKVFTRTTTGNLAGSEPISVTRPSAVPPPPPPPPP